VLTLAYRGSLASCNYSCGYCPFAKRRDTAATLSHDAQSLTRFVDWVLARRDALQIQFTPWGEALVRDYYRQAVLKLANAEHVNQVAVQTNLSSSLKWLEHPQAVKIALWATYHPAQVSLHRFVRKCLQLRALGIRFSVGVVAMHEHYQAIRQLRAALPPDTVIWLNAYDRRTANYYSADDLEWLDVIDPWFIHNRRPARSLGAPCRTGQDFFLVHGNGDVWRCHTVPRILGNLYARPLEDLAERRPCTRLRCECFVGYVHREDLPLREAFGAGAIGRLPASGY
jgi:hypothetical protein